MILKYFFQKTKTKLMKTTNMIAEIRKREDVEKKPAM